MFEHISSFERALLLITTLMDDLTDSVIDFEA